MLPINKIQDIKFKFYLEGKLFRCQSFNLTYGDQLSATVDLGYTSKHIFKIKPGTIGHIFLHVNNEWKIFFVGKLDGIFVSPYTTSLNFNNYYSELDSAYIITNKDKGTPDSVYLSKLVVSGETDKKLKFTINSKELLFNIFSTANMEKHGSISEYIKDILDTAVELNPWLKYVDSYMNLTSSIYILDNPNIFEFSKKVNAKTVFNKDQNLTNDYISFSQLLKLFFSRFRYTLTFFNTPKKINGKWYWAAAVPDNTFITPKFHIPDDQIYDMDYDENLYKPTRVVLHPTNSPESMGYTKMNSHRFLFSYPVNIFDGTLNNMYPVFTDDEKIRGINISNIRINDKETFYSLTNSVDLETGEFSKFNKDLYEYMGQIAEYRYLSMFKDNLNVNIFPNLNISTLYPVSISFMGTVYYMKINSINIAINSEGNINFNIVPSSLYKDMPKNLSWDPDEYKDNAKKFYSLISDEMMSEKEYWKSIGVSKITYTKSSEITAEKIYNSSNVRKDTGDTFFSLERVTPVIEVLSDIR